MTVSVNLNYCVFYAKIRIWPYLGCITGLNRIITDANLVVTQPTIKIGIWSQKAEIGLIGVWHNGNVPQGTNTIGMSRMTSRSQLIFDKSDSVRSRTEECKNHSHTLKLNTFRVIFIKAAEILALHEFKIVLEKLTLMDPLRGPIWGPLKTGPKP